MSPNNEQRSNRDTESDASLPITDVNPGEVDAREAEQVRGGLGQLRGLPDTSTGSTSTSPSTNERSSTAGFGGA
jgi:hypothetical protein